MAVLEQDSPAYACSSRTYETDSLTSEKEPMEQTVETRRTEKLVELVTFYLGGTLYGIDILKVQEINKLKDWTPVPHSEEYLLGILGLRGSIVTVIDLAKRLGLVQTGATDDSRSIIVNSGGRCAGLLVDSIGDVVNVDWNQVCEPPANVNGVQGRFFEGVLKTEDFLIAILDLEEVLEKTEKESQNHG